MRIVIIEDEIRIREGLSRLIGKLKKDWEVVGEAENGAEGKALILQAQPDIIITDIRMPVMDGLEMLTAVYQSGCTARAVVLSAYSEFEYARQAMRLGVKEYLLKPLVVGDISEALRRVEEEIHQEQSKEADMFGNIIQIFTGILMGSLEADEEMKERLFRLFQIPKDARYAGLCLYMGSRYDKEKEAARRELEQLFASRPEELLVLENKREKSLLGLVRRQEESCTLERWVQYWLLQDRSKRVKGAVGFVPDMGLEELKSSLELLMRYMEWNISLGDEVMISYPKIGKIQTIPCIYPLEIENQMKLAMCAGNRSHITKKLEEFYGYFRKGGAYEPKEIKECCVRFLWAFMNTGKEVGILDFEGVDQQRLLEQIMGAKTEEELRSVGAFLEEKLIQEDDGVTHLTIKRAQSLIQEFYQTGITLDEIADKLNITPEYLGTRFHKEMGVTFSTYIKNYRMNKARELLIGTSLKLYEIADKVGYSDPKYFSRVFKETTGQLPADYRKTHR